MERGQEHPRDTRYDTNGRLGQVLYAWGRGEGSHTRTHSHTSRNERAGDRGAGVKDSEAKAKGGRSLAHAFLLGYERFHCGGLTHP